MNPNSLAFFLLNLYGIKDQSAEQVILSPEQQKEMTQQYEQTKKKAKFNSKRKRR